MTPEAQHIAIAEACGWKLLKWNDRKGRPCEGWKDPTGKQCTDSSTIPDYLNDLNAMHEAEKVLKADQRAYYFYKLTELLGRPMMSLRHQQYLPLVTATAAQRAEAFLRTLILWDDTK